jgi:hypothetical protein
MMQAQFWFYLGQVMMTMRRTTRASKTKKRKVKKRVREKMMVKEAAQVRT